MKESIDTVLVVVPAHNESAALGNCLRALNKAASHRSLDKVSVRMLVALDDCTDNTREICTVPSIEVAYRNVGAARAAGFDRLLARAPSRTTWLATTDADTRVHPDWLAMQVRLANRGADAIFGVVDIDDWSAHTHLVRRRFESLYAAACVTNTHGHPHVHGASMGVRSSTYVEAGGFAALSVGEDRDLSDRLDRLSDVRVVRTTTVRVFTSARNTPRASGGFGDLLTSLGG